MQQNKSIIKVTLLLLTSSIGVFLTFFSFFSFIALKLHINNNNKHDPKDPPSIISHFIHQLLVFLYGSITPKTSLLLLLLLRIYTTSFIGLIIAAVAMHYRRHRTLPMRDTLDNKIIPRLHLTDSGRVHKLERFSQYVARQMGFGSTNECPRMSQLAEEYLKKGKGCEANMYILFANCKDSQDMLYLKLMEEFDRCILGYFAFHWSHATLMISQVLNVDSEPQGKLKNMVMAATRKQRFERVTKDLKVTRVFSTLVEELKAIRTPRDSQCTDVMVPAAHSERSPVLLLMGGGMGAGKSTVLKDILHKESFWSGAAGNAVIVEADAFKETDVIYKALSSRAGHHHDMLQTAELVHQSSTDAASSLLVTALNEGRDVIMDGTLSWEPFVEQTIAMARNVHRHRYRMGVGYKVAEDGTINENYWEQVQEDEQQEEEEHNEAKKRKPYRIEMVGVVCDAYLAVVRGVRRAILMGRAVRVKSQLKSHKRFAKAFPRYCQLVDNARLYCTDAMGIPPKLIGWKDGNNNFLVDPHQINYLKKLNILNEDADSIYELYQHHQDSEYESHPIWKDIMVSSSRASVQQELKTAIQNVENPPSQFNDQSIAGDDHSSSGLLLVGQ